MKYWTVNANSGTLSGIRRNGPFRKWTLWDKLWWRLRYGKLRGI